MKIRTHRLEYVSLHDLLDRYVLQERVEIMATIAKHSTWGDTTMAFITPGDFLSAVEANGIPVRDFEELRAFEKDDVLIHIDEEIPS